MINIEGISIGDKLFLVNGSDCNIETKKVDRINDLGYIEFKGSSDKFYTKSFRSIFKTKQEAENFNFGMRLTD